MANNSNIITRYDDMLYESRPASINEFLSNKYNNVHNELYNSALNKYIHSIIDKYVTKNLVYEFFELLSNIFAYEESDIVFDDIYQNIFAIESNTPCINVMLNDLSIDRLTFFKLFYNATIDKLFSIKRKLINFYEDEDFNIQSALENVMNISDIEDFRFAYISLMGGETNDDTNHLYTIEFDENEQVFVVNETIELIESNNNLDPFALFYSEDNDYVILFDYSNKARISYDKNGKLTLIVNETNKIKDINQLKDMINNYMNYESNNLIDTYKNVLITLFKRYHKIIEIKNEEYWQPSHVQIINKLPPYKKNIIDLTKYWNMIQDNSNSNLSDLKLTNENVLDSEIVEINYVNGTAKINSRLNDLTYEIPFKYLDENVNVSDELTLKDKFIEKYMSL